MFDAMLTLACEEALDREYAEAKAYAEANPVIPSEEFHKRMEKLIRGGTGKAAKPRKTQGRRVLRVCKRIAIAVMILCTISFIVLGAAAVNMEAKKREAKMHMMFKNGVNVDAQSDIQMESLEQELSLVILPEAGLPQDTGIQINIDGNLNVVLNGLSDDDAEAIRIFVEQSASLFQGAYAGPNQNRLYYVQSIIRWRNEIQNSQGGARTNGLQNEIIQECNRIIRDFMRESDYYTEDEIMSQSRNIEYVNGKLVF